jgi:hypothetical protein
MQELEVVSLYSHAGPSIRGVHAEAKDRWRRGRVQDGL